MRKIIAAINMTLDGVCDHTAGMPDDEIHEHYKDLITEADAILYGRITFELMQFWETLAKTPSGDNGMDEFAIAMDRVPKIVFSNTLKRTTWESAELSDLPLAEKVVALKKQVGKDVLVG